MSLSYIIFIIYTRDVRKPRAQANLQLVFFNEIILKRFYITNIMN